MCVSVTPQDAITERLFHSTIHALELFSIYLGRSLGLYRTLRDHGPLTSPALARHAGIHERYAREWLEQQAVAGFLTVAEESDDAQRRRYQLPDDFVGVLANEEHPAHVAPFAHMIVGIARVLPEVADAYRRGTGLEYSRFGDDFRFGQAGINRPAFIADLTNDWLPAVPDLHAALQQAARPRIGDVGCGAGWSTIALARAYPHAEVIGYDLDPASIADARRNAAEAGVTVEFRCADAATITADGPFDLLTMLETLHDLSHPGDVLASLRAALAADGSLFIADERVAEEFTAPGDELERMMYGWSITHCLPSGMAAPGAAPIGTAIRPATVHRLARESGFGSSEVLPIPNLLFRFYRLRRT